MAFSARVLLCALLAALAACLLRSAAAQDAQPLPCRTDRDDAQVEPPRCCVIMSPQMEDCSDPGEVCVDGTKCTPLADVPGATITTKCRDNFRKKGKCCIITKVVQSPRTDGDGSGKPRVLKLKECSGSKFDKFKCNKAGDKCVPKGKRKGKGPKFCKGDHDCKGNQRCKIRGKKHRGVCVKSNKHHKK